MAKSASIRDLRNHFPRIRKAVDTDGEVVLTERGEPRYRLVRYTPGKVKEPAPIDYWARLKSYQESLLTEAESRELQEENRGGR